MHIYIKICPIKFYDKSHDMTKRERRIDIFIISIKNVLFYYQNTLYTRITLLNIHIFF